MSCARSEDAEEVKSQASKIDKHPPSELTKTTGRENITKKKLQNMLKTPSSDAHKIVVLILKLGKEPAAVKAPVHGGLGRV